MAGANTTCSGTYTTIAADVTTGSIADTATATGMFGATPVVSAPITTILQLDANAVRQATQRVTAVHGHRADAITTMSPDTSRIRSSWAAGCLEASMRKAPQRRAARRSRLAGPVAPRPYQLRR